MLRNLEDHQCQVDKLCSAASTLSTYLHPTFASWGHQDEAQQMMTRPLWMNWQIRWDEEYYYRRFTIASLISPDWTGEDILDVNVILNCAQREGSLLHLKGCITYFAYSKVNLYFFLVFFSLWNLLNFVKIIIDVFTEVGTQWKWEKQLNMRLAILTSSFTKLTNSTSIVHFLKDDLEARVHYFLRTQNW